MGWIEAHGDEACLKVTFLVSTRRKTPYGLIKEQKARQSSAIITHQETDARDHGNLFLLRTYPRHHALPFPQPKSVQRISRFQVILRLGRASILLDNQDSSSLAVSFWDHRRFLDTDFLHHSVTLIYWTH